MSKEGDKFVFELMDALRAPVLTHASSWADCIPERVLKIIPLARMISLLNKEEMASIPECAAFIMTAGMEAPLDGDWTDIYTHVGCKMCQDWFHEDHWEEVKAPRTLTDYQRNYLLNPLRKHIWEKRRKILRERMKSESKLKEAPTPDEQVIIQEAYKVGQQLSLF